MAEPYTSAELGSVAVETNYSTREVSSLRLRATVEALEAERAAHQKTRESLDQERAKHDEAIVRRHGAEAERDAARAELAALKKMLGVKP